MQALAITRVMVTLMAATACTVSSLGQADRVRPDVDVSVRGHRLTIHLAAGATSSAAPLLVYMTGDGGWPGDERLFDRMMPWGLAMAGFNSADYVGFIDSPSRMISPDAVAADLGSVIDTAIRSLELPAKTPVVLVGFSRGAGLAVSAATIPAFRSRVRGILAIALTAEEDFVTEHPAGATTASDGMMPLYEALPKLGPLKVAVIQSTRDSFVPAAEARRRLGPDTPTRRLRPIDAAGHSFGGKVGELAVEMKASLDWILR
jgi:type IV secretory pathway VirJ component